MPSMHKLSNFATTITADKDHSVIVTYHATQIVKVSDTHIILNTGGYETVTTKRKMNQAANQFNLDYSVFQRKGEWFIGRNGQTVKFTGTTMTLPRHA